MLERNRVHRAAPAIGRLAISPVRPDYALQPIREGFDWPAILRDVRNNRQLSEKPLYLVAFRSLLKPDANRALLEAHDINAHIAALESPSLIHYFADTANEDGLSLSFCLWDDAAIAKALARDPRHRAATAMVTEYLGHAIDMFNVHHLEDPARFELVGHHEMGQPIPYIGD